MARRAARKAAYPDKRFWLNLLIDKQARGKEKEIPRPDFVRRICAHDCFFIRQFRTRRGRRTGRHRADYYLLDQAG